MAEREMWRMSTNYERGGRRLISVKKWMWAWEG
jgi:hypothetical protein